MHPLPPLVPETRAPASFAVPDELALWLERALGPAAGCVGDAAELRDAVLRALAQRFYRCVPVSTQAARIQAGAAAYAFAGWPRDRERAQIPARYRGAPEEYLWAAFKSGAPMPLPTRDLRRILIGVPDEG
jgi:hypothetical protein